MFFGPRLGRRPHGNHIGLAGSRHHVFLIELEPCQDVLKELSLLHKKLSSTSGLLGTQGVFLGHPIDLTQTFVGLGNPTSL